ncbi:hypothetical protein EC991_002220 [Linnemannia zychae]|nr:hypothetical protein EC991_002220 [Linnemannia zychae]
MRFSIFLASISLAAVASAATFSTASTSNVAADTNSTVTPRNAACFECLMNTFLQAVPACERAMLDDIGANVQLNDKGKSCVCPVSAIATKPAMLAPCIGPQLCLTNFTDFTSSIFARIGENNNCATYNAAVSTPLLEANGGAAKPPTGSAGTTSAAQKGMEAFGGKLVALTALLAMAATGTL